MTINSDAFNPERPIQSSGEDTLARRGFASQLADRIAAWKNLDSLTIGIYGPWGSGKTSLKNLVLDQLRQRHPGKVSVLEFNAWYWVHHENLHRAFFDELALTIGKANKSKDAKRAINLLGKYASYIDTTSHVAEGLERAAPFLIFALASSAGAIGAFVHPALLIVGLVVGISATFVRPVLKWTQELLRKIAESKRISQRERTLTELKGELRKCLSELKTPVLVTIDDIDRLPRESIRQICQLVRANADFPNVEYVMMFDRTIVESALRGLGQSGREFLEKIVQVPIDLPVADSTRIEAALFSRLDAILDGNSLALSRFDQQRWVNIYTAVLRQEFKTLRDVHRFANSIAFYVDLLTGEHAFEVNAVDLIALEVLRVFRPAQYEAIWRSQSLLTGRTYGAGSEERERTTKLISAVVDGAPEAFQSRFRQLLRELFPNIEWALGGAFYSDDSPQAWHNDLRVCIDGIFPRYFAFIPSGGELSENEIAELLTATGNSTGFAGKLRTYEQQGRLAEALENLSIRADSVAEGNVVALISALLPFAEHLPDSHRSRFGVSNHMQVIRTIRRCLISKTALDHRGQLMLDSFRDNGGLSIVHDLIFLDDKAAEKGDPSRPALFSTADLAALRAKWLAKLVDLSVREPVQLLRHPNIGSMLWRWREWGDESEVLGWFAEQTRHSDRLILILRAWSGQRTSQTFGESYVKRTTVLDAVGLAKWLAPADLLGAINALPALRNDEDLQTVKVARQAIEKLLDSSGKSSTLDEDF